MQLRTLTLDAFRGHTGSFEMPGRAVAIVGTNGSGKTSLLEACSVLLGFLISRLTRTENPRPLGFDDETWRVEGTRVRSAVSGELISDDAVIALAASRDAGVDSYSAAGIEAWLEESSRARFIRPVFAHYRTGRLWYDEPTHPVETETWRDGYRGCLDPALNAGAWARWLSAGDGEARRGELLRKLESVLRHVTGLQGQLELTSSSEWVWRRGNNTLPLRLLADGVRSFLTILLDLTARISRLNPAVETTRLFSVPGVVLLDEIDLHLHPAWQRVAVNMLLSTFPYIQFILTTHSPFVLKELPPGSVVNLDGRPGTNEGSIEDITEDVLGISVPQRSLRQHRLLEAARAYFSALNTAPADTLEHLRAEYEEAMAPFANDSAAIALLRLEELAAQGRQR